MAVGLSNPTELRPVAGVRLCALAAGIRYTGRDDVAILAFDEGTTAAAVFTRNAFCAAPVTVAREHINRMAPRLALINSGNANAGTGQAGLNAARESCESLARVMNVAAQQVLPFSTGVIGEVLPIERLQASFAGLDEQLDEDAWLPAAKAIMTTDTVAKGISKQIDIGGKTITLTGIAKGSGMIRPDMATMLAFVATDAALDAKTLQCLLDAANEKSFNRITVDGDTSTNDACLLVATGASKVTLASDSTEIDLFADALNEVLLWLAQAMIRDGEGATKFVAVRVDGGRDTEECLQVAYTIAHSPLVKTALFASDPNWGRILAAVGRSGIEDLDVDAVQLWLDDCRVADKGGLDPEYQESEGNAVMAKEAFQIRVDLGRGNASDTVWTSDLSYDYVKINADYRS